MRKCDARTKSGKLCQNKISAANNWQCGISGHPPNPPSQNSQPKAGAAADAWSGVRFRDTEDGPALVSETLEALPSDFDCYDPAVAAQLGADKITNDITWGDDETGFTPSEIILRARRRLARYGHISSADSRHNPKAALTEPVSLPEALTPVDRDGNHITDQKRLAYNESFHYMRKEFEHTADHFANCDVSAAIGEMYPGRATRNMGLHTAFEFEQHPDTSSDDIAIVLDSALMHRLYVNVGNKINSSLADDDTLEDAARAAAKADPDAILRPRIIAGWVTAAHAAAADDRPLAYNRALFTILAERGQRPMRHPITKHAAHSALSFVDREIDNRRVTGADVSEDDILELFDLYCDSVLTAREQYDIVELAQNGSVAAAAETLQII